MTTLFDNKYVVVIYDTITNKPYIIVTKPTVTLVPLTWYQRLMFKLKYKVNSNFKIEIGSRIADNPNDDPDQYKNIGDTSWVFDSEIEAKNSVIIFNNASNSMLKSNKIIGTIDQYIDLHVANFNDIKHLFN